MIAEKQKCLDAATLADLLTGRMPTERFSQALEHIESCQHCMQAAEGNSNNAKLPWSIEDSDSFSIPKFETEPECSAVVGNLLIQPVPSAGDKSASLSEVRPPREMLGPYRLISSLGSGGMGTVYLAEHQRLKRQVALKLLPRDKLARSGWLDRFNREMTAIAGLEHPNIVRAMDAGDEDQWHYLVMEHLDGLDLNRVARRIPDIPVGTACEIVRQAALGLGAIHDAGMVHRDIKPSNVFLTRSGVVKLLDLGLVLDGESPLLADERLTTVGHLMGTLPFMAREQLDDARNVDWRTDIYSLGATLYRLLSGRPPYGSADNLARTIQDISTTEAKSIAERRNDLPIDLISVVDRMLSSNVATRPQSAIEVAELLQPFCKESGLKELIRTAMQCTVDQETSEHNLLPRAAPDSSSVPPRSRWPWWIAAALVPFAFAAGILVMIATDCGTLVLETDQPNASIRIVRADKVVEQLEVVQNQPSTLTLRSGRYVIELTGVDANRMEVTNNQVVLSRGEQQVVKVIRKESNALAESVGPTPEAIQPGTIQPGTIQPGMADLAIPTKTFQDKSLVEWTGILLRERSADSVARAMEAVQSLVDSPDEKLAAAKQFLQASRLLGGDSTSQSSAIRVSTGLTPTELIMNALENYFPKLCSFSPGNGPLFISEELENGTPQSKTACICLLNRFVNYPGKAKSTSLFDEMSRVAESQNLLQRLDRLVSAAVQEITMHTDTKEKGYRLRVAINKSLARDLKTDLQMTQWAKGNLKQANEYLSAQSETLDTSTAAATFRLLEETDLDLSPLFAGLIQPMGDGSERNDTTAGELESIVAKLCQRNPIACVMACEAFLIPGRERGGFLLADSRGKPVLDNLAKNHPRPLDAITKLLNDFGSHKFHSNSNLSTFQQLLVRVVLELDRVNDPEIDSKLAYAANAFAHFEIPAEFSGKVMTVFLKRILDPKMEKYTSIPIGSSFQTWYTSSSRYNAETRKQIWNEEHLYSHVEACCIRNPSGTLDALIREANLENAKPFWLDRIVSILGGPLAALTTNGKIANEYDLVTDARSDSLVSYLKTESAKAQMTSLSVALDSTLVRVVKEPSLKDKSIFAYRLPVYFDFRLTIGKFLNQVPSDSEPLGRALRALAASESVWTLPRVEEAIAELVGYEAYPIQRLCTLAQSPLITEGASRLVQQIHEADPLKFQSYFLTRLESVNSGEAASELFEKWYTVSTPNKVWGSIFQQLLDDPASCEPTTKAIQRLIEIVIRDSDELNGKTRADTFRSLLKSQ
jgi:serine/threonine protein kinase